MSILYSDVKKENESSIHSCNHESFISIINSNRVAKKHKYFCELINLRDTEKMYCPFFYVYINSMKEKVNHDIAEEKLQQCVDFLESKLHIDDVCIIQDVKSEADIYFGHFQLVS